MKKIELKMMFFIMSFFITLWFLLFVMWSKYYNNIQNDFFENSKKEIFSHYSWYDEDFEVSEYNLWAKEIFDLDIGYKKQDLKNWLIILKFFNNKTSQLIDKIIHSKTSNLKYYSLLFLENYNYLNENILQYQININIIDSEILIFDENKYIFDISNLDEILFKYYYLDYIWNINYRYKIFNDLYAWFENFSETEQYKILFYLSLTWNLDYFLSEKNIDLTKIELTKLEADNLIIYNFIQKKLWNEDIDYLTNIDLIKKQSSEISDFWKIIFISLLQELNYEEKSFENIYKKFEKKWNYNLSLSNKMLKFILFTPKIQDYNSFETENIFWFSIWSVHNRRVFFELSGAKKTFLETYKLKETIYDNWVEFRIANLREPKFYFDIDIKK